jgi:hypothetical protein
LKTCGDDRRWLACRCEADVSDAAGGDTALQDAGPDDPGGDGGLPDSGSVELIGDDAAPPDGHDGGDVPPLDPCADGARNGGETDVDCGGPCAPCGLGDGCGAATDCLSGLCAGGVCALPPSCGDNVKNGGESDVDCGGPCAPCATGRLCNGHTDCLSATCIYGVCKEPTCQDDLRNQGEADVDCGGPCAACPDGSACDAAADCASASCHGHVCVSCDDDQKNGGETDVDCGGNACDPCGNGKHCAKPADCVGGGCQGGTCCTANDCGVCAATPKEVCNGKDDDCDGFTDLLLEDFGQLCPLQKGVCAGAEQYCKAGAWVCDAAAYSWGNSYYQATETSCDGRDNDCDGTTDEGLLNACGKCGSVPAEVCNGKDDDCDGDTDEGLLNVCGKCGSVPAELCNGRDDDCDGDTDEVAACASCQATPPMVELSSLYSSAGSYYTIDHANALVAVGTSAYATYRAGNTPATKRLADGAIQQVVAAPGAIFVEGGGIGTPSLAAFGDRVLLTYVRVPSNSTFAKVYSVPIDASGALTPTVLYEGTAGSFYTASASFGDRTLVVVDAGTVAYQNDWRLYESTDPTAAEPELAFVETMSWYDDAKPQLRFRSDGHAVAFVRTYKDYYGDWHYAAGDLDGGSGAELLVATQAVFQPRSDLDFAAAWSALGGKVYYQEGSSSAPWAAGLELASGGDAALGVGPDDGPVVTFTTSNAKTLIEARRNADGTFVTRTLLEAPEHEVFLGTSVAVDTAGRAHVAAQVMNSNYPSGSRYKLIYLMSCWGG